MHCYSRLPDAALFILRFKCDANAKLELKLFNLSVDVSVLQRFHC